MSAAPAQETRRELPQSREAYLDSYEKEWAEIHEGKPPETGLKEKGKLERKTVCEDAKLKNREKGLFVIADGVSTSLSGRGSGNGWFASRESTRVMYEQLGEKLDREIENIVSRALRDGVDPTKEITEHVMAGMVAAVSTADSRIQAAAVHREFADSATTLTCAKLIDIPDGKGGSLQRLFFTNLGDSRLYLLPENGRLQKLTQDDSWLQGRVAEGEITQEEADLIDQAADKRSLPPKLFPYANHLFRSSISRTIGIGEVGLGQVEVFSVEVKPGDRFLLTGDGESDQLLESEMEQRISSEPDDDRAEGSLQQGAMEMSLYGKAQRSKADDISATVHTVGERGPDRKYLYKDQKEARTGESLKQDLGRLRLGQEAARQEVQRIQIEVAKLDSLTPKRERLALLIQMEKAREVESTYSYHLEKSQLDMLDEQLVPRFQTGEQVQVWREDFDPPSLDRHMWTVVSYDPQSKAYALRGPGATAREVSRYELEKVQTGLMVRLGDELPAVNEIGARERGFKVIAFDRDGTVILAKEANNVIKRLRVNAEDVNESFHLQLHAAERSRLRMVQATENYQDALRKHQSYKDDAELVGRIESRQRALDAAKPKG